MTVDIRLIGYDYVAGKLEYVAIDPDTKAVLVKDISPGVTDHGELTGLGDDDHVQYYNQARGDARYLRLAGGTMAGLLTLSGTPTVDLHASTKKYVDDHVAGNLSELTIDVNKDWNAKNITNMGTVEHKGATLKAGIQTEGRASGNIYPHTNHDYDHDYIGFREKMTNTPSSITLSNVADTIELNLRTSPQAPWAERISVFGFNFVVSNEASSRAYSLCKKYVTVGN